MLTSTRAGGHGGSYWTHVSLIWGSLWPRLTHAMLVSSKHSKHNTFNKQEPVCRRPYLCLLFREICPPSPIASQACRAFFLVQRPPTSFVACKRCYTVINADIYMWLSNSYVGSIHPWTHACTCSESGETYEHLSWKKAHHICEAQVQGGGCWWWGMGERRGPGVTSSWAPGRGQSILTHPFLQISLCHSISNFVSYVHNLFVPTVISSLPELRFISDIWSRHVEACTTHLVSVCDPFLRPPVCVWLCDTHCATIFCPFYLWLGLATIHRGTAALHLRRLRYLSTITRAHQHKLKRNKQMKSMIHMWFMHVWSMYIKCMSAGTY